ncbi:PepSY domain-containing protein [Sphingosinicella soli]|uniref:Putative membrane protein YkoI n=1 Tax=Sphingosinicella soli TaxID=333708 RepID=A0A7W7F577_9SPHN|nr:PepSY domain-containing protein [Sphingosinicella soli]MBB4631026.1 putative membrane protein YkoI [Sphingosinicella soli]
MSLKPRLRAVSLTLLAATGALALASGAPAKDKKAQHKAAEATSIRAAVERGDILSLPQILALAQARVPGDVLKIELEQDDGVLSYEVKILTRKGRVREVELDARTGALIGIEDD